MDENLFGGRDALRKTEGTATPRLMLAGPSIHAGPECRIGAATHTRAPWRRCHMPTDF